MENAADLLSELQDNSNRQTVIPTSELIDLSSDLQNKNNFAPHPNQQQQAPQQQQIVQQQLQQFPQQQPTNEAMAQAQKKIEDELAREKQFEADADALIAEIEKAKAEKKDVSTPTEVKSDNQNISLSLDERQEILKRVAELESELQKKDLTVRERDVLLKAKEQEADLRRGTAKSYLEKAQSLESDETRREVPEELASLVHLRSDYGKTNSKVVKDRLDNALIYLVEKHYGKKLDRYLQDLYTYGGDTPTTSEAVSQYDMSKFTAKPQANSYDTSSMF